MSKNVVHQYASKTIHAQYPDVSNPWPACRKTTFLGAVCYISTDKDVTCIYCLGETTVP